MVEGMGWGSFSTHQASILPLHTAVQTGSMSVVYEMENIYIDEEPLVTQYLSSTVYIQQTNTTRSIIQSSRSP
jgi:hypothetical protein